jgi:hypothetical protein
LKYLGHKLLQEPTPLRASLVWWTPRWSTILTAEKEKTLKMSVKYRVIKKSLCTWWLQYRKLRGMFRVSPTSLQTFIGTRFTLMPSVIPNSYYIIMISDWNCLKYF